MTDKSHNSLSLGFYIRLTFLAWLTMIGFDFFLHAGVLAPLYVKPSTFLLPPEQAFALIPLGYLSFLGLAVLLIWLMTKLNIHNWQKGALFGTQLGLLAWGSLVLGLYSISTASPILLLGWFFGQVIELGFAGAVVGHGLRTRNLGRLFLIVLVFVIIAFVAGIVWQNVM
jgi:tryptophan-rich sensory protein